MNLCGTERLFLLLPWGVCSTILGLGSVVLQMWNTEQARTHVCAHTCVLECAHLLTDVSAMLKLGTHF